MKRRFVRFCTISFQNVYDISKVLADFLLDKLYRSISIYIDTTQITLSNLVFISEEFIFMRHNNL